MKNYIYGERTGTTKAVPALAGPAHLIHDHIGLHYSVENRFRSITRL